MDVWNSKRVTMCSTFFMFSILVLSGCYGNGNDGSSVPFSALTTAIAGDGIGASAQFNSPSAITTDGTNLYVADSGNNTIRQIVIASNWVTTIAGSKGVSGSSDGTHSKALFNSPYGIMTDGTYLYVTDTLNNAIRKVTIATGVVTTLSSQLNYPQGITADGTNFYVANTHGNSILEVAILTGTGNTLAGTTTAGSSNSTDGTGATTQFYAPEGVATDGTNLYVIDTDNNSVRSIVIATGATTTLVGPAGSALCVPDTVSSTAPLVCPSGSNDGTGSAAQFNSPSGITIDPTKTYLYVADTGNNSIRRVVIATGATSTLAGPSGSTLCTPATSTTPAACPSGSNNGTGSAAQFNSPFGITTDGTNLYVADTNNNTIRKVAIASGVVTTLAGTAPLQSTQ